MADAGQNPFVSEDNLIQRLVAAARHASDAQLRETLPTVLERHGWHGIDRDDVLERVLAMRRRENYKARLKKRQREYDAELAKAIGG